eukprot:12488672-Alexandrium_andersonii.AAC.1
MRRARTWYVRTSGPRAPPEKASNRRRAGAIHHGRWQPRSVGRRCEYDPQRFGKGPKPRGQTREVGELARERADLPAWG